MSIPVNLLQKTFFSFPVLGRGFLIFYPKGRLSFRYLSINSFSCSRRCWKKARTSNGSGSLRGVLRYHLSPVVLLAPLVTAEFKASLAALGLRLSGSLAPSKRGTNP
ncbi:hypothetical protein I7I53_00885 [Histoplasma capsulatum var. duboisii H88]|uniref:Uncharacterized protein n=1 Tax=Ajellomyces capsulatus (strain H88) TaxID=544711 RepID=A0A8A1LNU4_AJEC8|nr:hypothetical protein I7I53_00885 [Histoplasma capsulatum var. duboisii H88]